MNVDYYTYELDILILFVWKFLWKSHCDVCIWVSNEHPMTSFHKYFSGI